MECSYFSEGMGSEKSDMRHAMNRILGDHLLNPWKPMQGSPAVPNVFRQAIDRRVQQPRTAKSFIFPE